MSEQPLSAVAPAPSLHRRPDPLSVRAIIAADRGIYRFAAHWLLAVNLLALPLAALPLVAPALRAAGARAVAEPIYAFFGLICHQRGDRSFHAYGEKMACCHRCFALYGGFFAIGVLYLLLRSRRPGLKPLKPLWTILLCAPLALDGLVQLGGRWESSWQLRVSTGILFAVGLCWFLLPFLERGFAQIRRDLERRFFRLVAQGRARPLPGAPPAE